MGKQPFLLTHRLFRDGIIPVHGETTKKHINCGRSIVASSLNTGNNQIMQIGKSEDTASPPHAGKQPLEEQLCVCPYGITPVHGEQPSYLLRIPPWSGFTPVHGEFVGTHKTETHYVMASSPNAGKQHRWGSQFNGIISITPACGESTYPDSRIRWIIRHHPRTRGIDVSRHGYKDRSSASPPHAGNNFISVYGTPYTSAHPRTQGIDVTHFLLGSDNTASSPHAGNRPLLIEANKRSVGITPVHGESTMTQCMRSRSQWLHPHTRGIDRLSSSPPLPCRASPPYTGNRRRDERYRCLCKGITPTHGESTMTQCMRSRSQWLHPHTRGIDYGTIIASCMELASPPYTGNRLVVIGDIQLFDGITPVHGESTLVCPVQDCHSKASPPYTGNLQYANSALFGL